MYWAISELPTNPTAAMSGWVKIASTASLSPCTTWNTPAGRPASRNSSARRTGTDGSRSEGLRINAFPHASAGPAFHNGIMAGKLNGVIPATHAQGLAQRIHVNARPGSLAVFALEQMRDADTKLDDVDTALNVSTRVWQRLAVLARQHLGELVEMLVDQLDKPHHHPGPALRIERRPLLLRLRRRSHRGVDLALAAHG